MPHVSRNKLSKQAEDELVSALILVFGAIHKSEEMGTFLNAIMTPIERIMLAKRLAIILLIEEGSSDAEIANVLHLTRVTVAKMRYFYESRGKGFTIALQKLEEQKQLERFKSALISLVRYSARAAGGRI